MEIRVGFEIAYAAAAPTPMVMMRSIHPSRRHDIIGTERIMAEPDVAIGFYRDSFDNIRLVRGLSVRPVVHLRRPSQSSADRPHPDGHRPRRRRRGADHEFWSDESGEIRRRQR
jgi:hypothetical protein